MTEMTQDESKELGLIARCWVEHSFGIGISPPPSGPIVQRASATGYCFPTDHLPEGSC